MSNRANVLDAMGKNEPEELAAVFMDVLRRGWKKWEKMREQRDEARKWAKYYKAKYDVMVLKKADARMKKIIQEAYQEMNP